MRGDLAELIEAADLNALLRAVDVMCMHRDWDGLIDLAERCDEAVERGKQLWPISAHIDYRLALEAPGELAAGVLHPDVGRFSHGPLTEVLGSSHTWDEVAPHIAEPQLSAYVAQERVLRGEDLTGDERAHAHVLELPLGLMDWEPPYRVATFKSDHVEIPEPQEPKAPLAEVTASPGERLDEPEIESALLDLVGPWVQESNGAARVAVVEGGADRAVAHLTYGGFRLGPLTPQAALERMAWAAAGGGAHGRRRGAAFGRYLALSTAAVLADVTWPPDFERLGEAVASLRWYRWDEGTPEKGWVLRLAVADEENGWAAAIGASDLREDDDDD